MAAAQTYQSEFSGSQMDERFRAVATLAEALTVLEQAIAAKYTKPADGIPSTDMDASVQSALALALTSVQSLADYYTKSQVDSIAAAIAAAVNATSGEVVASLPTASASTLGKIYYVGPTSGEYDRYVTSYDGTTYSWLQIGTTDVDMTQYATKAELSQLDQEVNGKDNSASASIPIVAGQGNTYDTGAYADVSVKAGEYDVVWDNSILSSAAILYVRYAGENSYTSVGALSSSPKTFAKDVTRIGLWAVKATVLSGGDCLFQIKDTTIVTGIKERVGELEETAEKVDGYNKDTRVDIAVSTSSQADSVKTSCEIQPGSYYIDIANPEIFNSKTSSCLMYAWDEDGTKISLGSLSPNSIDYWGASEETQYLREATFVKKIVALSMYRGANVFNATGYLALSFVDKNPVLSTAAQLAIDRQRANSPQVAFSASETVAAGEVLTTPLVTVVKNSSLTVQIIGNSLPISIGVGYDANGRTYDARWIEIDATYIKHYQYLNDTILMSTVEHGLILDDKTMVSIIHQDSGSALRIYTKLGAMYEDTSLNWWGVGTPFCENNGSESINVSMNFEIGDISKNVWIIGDSYCGLHNNHRWPTQLTSMGIRNFLMCARGGEAPASGLVQLQNLLSLGRIPAYLVWALGGNGQGDISGAISGYQKLNLWKLQRLAASYQLTLILTTVPSFVADGRKHHAYNDYVRSLGYRYIDVANAIGSQSDGTAYPGMFEPDNVHPSEEGARVIAQQVLLDFPEIQMKES